MGPKKNEIGIGRGMIPRIAYRAGRLEGRSVAGKRGVLQVY